MPTAPFERGGIAVDIDGFLLGQNCGRGLESCANDDGFAVGDTALNTAGIICARVNPAAIVVKGIVVCRAGHRNTAKTRAGFETLAGRQRKHGFGEVRLEFVKDRFAPAGRNAMGNGLDHATEGIAIFAGSIDALNDSLGNLGIGHAGDIRLDLLAGNR